VYERLHDDERGGESLWRYEYHWAFESYDDYSQDERVEAALSCRVEHKLHINT
jgi:hypothetical protein